MVVGLTDINHDGFISGSDIPHTPGSPEAKAAWDQIDADAHSPASVAKAKVAGFKDATGWYMGKPLIPGAGDGQGDYQLLVDKLVFSKGFSPESAAKIAGKVASAVKAKAATAIPSKPPVQAKPIPVSKPVSK